MKQKIEIAIYVKNKYKQKQHNELTQLTHTNHIALSIKKKHRIKKRNEKQR